LSRLFINIIIIILHWLLVYDSTTWEDVARSSLVKPKQMIFHAE
jgi:hypothetical protein